MISKQRTFVVCLVMVFLAGFSGCTKETPDQVTDLDRMQGTWTGMELAEGREGVWMLVINSDQIEVDGPGSEDYSGILTINETIQPKTAQLNITMCTIEEYIGTTANFIYKFEDDKFILAGAEPGSETKPASFEDGNNIRYFVFQKVQTQ